MLGEQIRAQSLRVAGYPNIEPKEASGSDALEFTAVFEVYPEIVVADVSAQGIERPQLNVTDAEVDRTLDVLRKQRTVFEPIERAAQDGDRVVVDFTGRKDGEEFEGGKATDFVFVIGGGLMLKEFETAVLGLNAGESKGFDMTFPADYHAAHLAGQTVQFEVVHEEGRGAQAARAGRGVRQVPGDRGRRRGQDARRGKGLEACNHTQRCGLAAT